MAGCARRVPDPIVSDFSPYSYAHNSPLQYVDPVGQFPWPAIGIWVGLNLLNATFNQIRGPRVRNSPIGLGNSYLNSGIRPTTGRSGFVDDFSGRNGLAQTARAYANYRRYGLTGSGIPVLVTPEDVRRYNSRVITNSAISFARATGKAGKYGLKTLGFAWTFPNTAIGFAAVGINELVTGKPEFVGFDEKNWVWGWRNTWYPFGGGNRWITFGHVVLANNPWDRGFLNSTYLNHELVHVFQYDLFGPAFIPIYLTNYGVNLLLKPFGLIDDAYAQILFELWAYHIENSRR
jgi:hypothetical protein